MTSTNAFLLDENENTLNLIYNLKSILSNFYASSHLVVHIYLFEICCLLTSEDPVTGNTNESWLVKTLKHQFM